MKTLKYFNSVLYKKSSNKDIYISEDGYIVERGALWAKDRIIDYYRKEKLNGNDLNKTFYKSWDKIKNSSRYELYLDQIKHYLSTYGSNFKDEAWIPNDLLDIPDVKITYTVIKALTKEELIEKCLSLLRSGIALKEETIDDLLSMLVDDFGYSFTGNENIKNREAIVKIADMYNVLPTNNIDFMRYIVYRATGDSLLIKSEYALSKIKESSFNPSVRFKLYGLDKLAENFNRYKPIFLSFKNKCPKTINKISKLSKKYHKPLVINPLNEATHSILRDEDKHWLDNATPYMLFRVLFACHSRIKGQDTFVYRIRNGKSWVQENGSNKKIAKQNFDYIISYMKEKYSLLGKKIYIPENIKYGLPTSEKMYIGNIPTGTRFYGNKMAVGVYWKNSWGATDLDLSGINIGGKIGWNSSYNQNNDLMYSGDITNAPNGAVEYLYANKGLSSPTIVQNNVYSGDVNCEYKIIIGTGDKISRDYMMNPDNLFVDIKCKSVQKQTILGIIIPKKEKQCFVLLNFGAGDARVSGSSEITKMYTNALYQKWEKPLSFNKLVQLLGAEIVIDKDNVDIDLSLDKLDKTSFMKIFDGK